MDDLCSLYLQRHIPSLLGLMYYQYQLGLMNKRRQVVADIAMGISRMDMIDMPWVVDTATVPLCPWLDDHNDDCGPV